MRVDCSLDTIHIFISIQTLLYRASDISRYIFWDQKIYFEMSVVWDELEIEISRLTTVLCLCFQLGIAELDMTDNEEGTIRNNLKRFRSYIENCVKVHDLIGHFGGFTKGTSSFCCKVNQFYVRVNI